MTEEFMRRVFHSTDVQMINVPKRRIINRKTVFYFFFDL